MSGGGPPVLLVHGYLASPALMIPMRDRLAKRGISARTVELSPGAIQSVQRLSSELAVNVERALRETGADRVDLVGVSFGGLISLAYAQENAHLRQVRRLVAVGTPFQGTWTSLAGIPVMGGISRGIWQTTPMSGTIARMRSAGVPAGVERMVSIAMAGDLTCPPSRCTFDGADFIELSGWPTLVTHQWLVLSPHTTEIIGDQLLA